MRIPTLALATSLLAGLLVSPLSAQDAPSVRTSGQAAAARVAQARHEAVQAARTVPNHPAPKSPAEARVQARRLADFHAWQENVVTQQHTERARAAHRRRAAAVGQEQQAVQTRPVVPDAVARKRMARMQGQRRASQVQSPRAPRHAAKRVDLPKSSVGHRTLQPRHVPQTVQPKSVKRASRPDGR